MNDLDYDALHNNYDAITFVRIRKILILCDNNGLIAGRVSGPAIPSMTRSNNYNWVKVCIYSSKIQYE